MKPNFSIDTSNIEDALRKIDFSTADLLSIEGAGARVIVNGMRMRVPVDTSATKNSIISHLEEYDESHVVDEIGPETDYSWYIEYGHEKPDNYPMQPFVRPTVRLDFGKVIRAIGTTFGAMVVSRWPK